MQVEMTLDTVVKSEKRQRDRDAVRVTAEIMKQSALCGIPRQKPKLKFLLACTQEAGRFVLFLLRSARAHTMAHGHAGTHFTHLTRNKSDIVFTLWSMAA